MENSFNGQLWLEKAKELYNLQQQRKAIEKTEKALSEELRVLQFNEPLSYGGMYYFYEQRIGPIDYTVIPELKLVDVEMYRKPLIKVWKLAVVQL